MAETHHLTATSLVCPPLHRSGTPAARSTGFLHRLCCACAITLFGLATAWGQDSESSPVPPSSVDQPEDRDAITLVQCIDRALAFNPQIRQAEQSVLEAIGAGKETQANALPQIAAEGQWTRLDDSSFESFDSPMGPVTFGQEESWRAGPSITQVLYSGGQVRAAVRVAGMLDDVAISEYERVVADTLLQVKTAYYDVLLARANIAVREQTIELLEEQRRTTQERVQAGSSPRFDLLRADVELANAKPPLIQARNDYILAHDRLANLLAIGVEERGRGSAERSLNVVGEFSLPIEHEELDAAIQDALGTRPEILAMERQIDIQKQNLIIARGGYMPKVGAFANYTWQAGQINDDVYHGWAAGFQASWDIFDGFKTRGKVEQSRAQLEKAKIALEDNRRQIELEVRAAHADLQRAIELLDASIQNVSTAEESVRLSQVRYTSGVGTQLEVLDAQVALTEAKTNVVFAQYTYHVAKAALLKARGASVLTHYAAMPYHTDQIR